MAATSGEAVDHEVRTGDVLLMMETSGLARSLAERRWPHHQLAEPCQESDPAAMVVSSAIQRGGSLAAELPEFLQRDRNFLVQAVRCHPDLWLTLRSSSSSSSSSSDFGLEFIQEAILMPIQNDSDIGSTSSNLSHEIAAAILEQFPSLRSHRGLWDRIIESNLTTNELPDLFQQYASQSVRADSDLIRRASICNADCLLYADPFLFESRDLLEFLVLELEWKDQPSLMYIPFQAQMMNPDLVGASFSKIPNVRSRSRSAAWASWVAPSLWNNRTIVKAWFKAGLPFVDGQFPNSWKGDAELFLLLAQHCSHRRASFRLASPKLRHSKAFMLKVVEHNPSLIRYASHKLQRDFDVIVTALASTDSNADAILDFARNAFSILERNNRGLDFIDNIDARVQQKLEAHAVFNEIIRPAMVTEQSPSPTSTLSSSSSSPLSLLNQGAETAQGYTQCLMAYLDVPEDKELRILRQALDKLTLYYEEKRKRHPFLRKIGQNNYELRV